ncbi:MAG: N-acetylmuramoyl-L-alanine amidase [Lachnospiraceae bacterium]|nr:N-acetylmuramoyl-L-alanine amidase [Lachnospiraceae bacterium]
MSIKHKIISYILTILLITVPFVFAGCSETNEGEIIPSQVPVLTNALIQDLSPALTDALTQDLTSTPTLTPTPTNTLSPALTPTPTNTLSPALTPTPAKALTPSKTPYPTNTLTPTPANTLTPTATNTPNSETGIISTYIDIPIEEAKGFICLNPGHQHNSNTEQEPDGPGSSVTKKKVSYGAAGELSGRESVLNLKVALILRNILGERGYKVLLTRETEMINISNIERAQIANENNCDLLIHLHHNSSSNEAKKGAETICATKNNPYHPELYNDSSLLAKLVIDAVCEKTEFVNKGVYYSDTYTGINWSCVPVIFTELGYLSNAEDDAYLANDDNIYLMCEGIANGIDAYFKQKTE